MMTVQNGKGSRSRIGDVDRYRRNFEQIDFSRKPGARGIGVTVWKTENSGRAKRAGGSK